MTLSITDMVDIIHQFLNMLMDCLKMIEFDRQVADTELVNS